MSTGSYLTAGGREASTKPPGGRPRRDSAPRREDATPGVCQPFRVPLIGCRKTRQQPHQPPIGSEMPVDMVAEVRLAGLFFRRPILPSMAQSPCLSILHYRALALSTRGNVVPLNGCLRKLLGRWVLRASLYGCLPSKLLRPTWLRCHKKLTPR